MIVYPFLKKFENDNLKGEIKMPNLSKARIQQKRETQANWEKSSLVPKDGEIIVYKKDSNNPAPRMKIGDGSTNVNNLPFVGGSNEIFVDYAVGTEQTNNINLNISQGTSSPIYALTKIKEERIVHIILGTNLSFNKKHLNLTFNNTSNTNTSLNQVTYRQASSTWATVANILTGGGYNNGQTLTLIVKGSGTAGQFEYVRLLNLPYPSAESMSF